LHCVAVKSALARDRSRNPDGNTFLACRKEIGIEAVEPAQSFGLLVPVIGYNRKVLVRNPILCRA
jgi:hypothetical protein